MSLNGTQATSVGLTEDLMEDSSGRIKKEFQPIDGECMKAQNQFNDIPISASDPSSCSADGSSSFEYSTGRNKEEIQFVDGESRSVGNEFNDIPNRSASDLQRTSATGTLSYIICGLSATGNNINYCLVVV